MDRLEEWVDIFQYISYFQHQLIDYHVHNKIMTIQKHPIRSSQIPYALILLTNIGGGLHLIPVFIQLLINTCSCVYIGCINSTPLTKNQTGEIQTFSKSMGEDQALINMKEAKKFPIVASCFLLGFYALYKFLPLFIFKGFIDFYFSLTTVISTASIIVEMIGFSEQMKKTIFKSNVHPWLQDFLEAKIIQISKAKIVCALIACVPIIFYFLTKHWILNNIFGIMFSIMALRGLSLSSMKTGLVLLWILFFYDIFWVYGTDVMVTVAKNLDIPIKIVFPYLNAQGVQKMSMVGLGDIVLPGIFVSLCLKIDIDRFFKTSTAKQYSQISLPYFSWCFGGYILGIFETFMAMYIFNHPQPALLFLVPMCTLSVLLRAYIYGEFNEIFNYDSELQSVEEEEKKKKELEEKEKGETAGAKKDD